MISTTRFKRMYLVPENIYKNVYDNSNPLEKENLETLNSKHFDDAGDYFMDNFKKEPKHVFKTKKLKSAQESKTKKEDTSSNDDYNDIDDDDDDDDDDNIHEKSASSKTSNNSIFDRSNESDASTPPKSILKRRTQNGDTPHPSDVASLHKKNPRKKIDAVYDEGPYANKVSTPIPSTSVNKQSTLLACKVCGKKYKYEKPKQVHENTCKDRTKYQFLCQTGKCSKNLIHQFKSKRDLDNHNKKHHSISISVSEINKKINKKSPLLSPKTRNQKKARALSYNQSYSFVNKN